MDGRDLCLQPQHLARPFQLIGDVKQENTGHLHGSKVERKNNATEQ